MEFLPDHFSEWQRFNTQGPNMLLDGDLLRSVIIEVLRKHQRRFDGSDPFRVQHLFHEVAAVAHTKGLQVSDGMDAWRMNSMIPELHVNLRSPVWTIVWDMIIEGILRPGAADGDKFELPYIHVTDYGRQVISGELTPYDPTGYLKELKFRIPEIDPVIEKYIAEAAETLRRHCLLSSTVTLGCASEMAFLLLSDAYRAALKPIDQTAYEASVEKTRGIKQHHQVFMAEYQKIVPKLKAELGTDWVTGMEKSLDHVFSYFRQMRNNAGHPSGYTFTKEMVAAHLILFPSYLRHIYDLIKWCDTNRPL